MPTRTRKSPFLAEVGEQKIGKRALRKEEEEEMPGTVVLGLSL